MYVSVRLEVYIMFDTRCSNIMEADTNLNRYNRSKKRRVVAKRGANRYNRI